MIHRKHRFVLLNHRNIMVFIKWFIIVVSIQFLLILMVFISGKILLSQISRTKETFDSKILGKPVPTATPTPDPLRPFSILLLGYGGGIHEGGTLTDSIMLVLIDPKQKRVHLISIPRDLYVPMPLGEVASVSAKINTAYPYGYDMTQHTNRPDIYKGKNGGGNLAKEAVAFATGISVDYYIAISFDGFIKAIDSVGGIDVAISKPFHDPFYPIDGKETDICEFPEEEVKKITATMSGDLLERMFPCRYENLKFEKGVTHMDGKTALKYARSRHSSSDGGDFSRAIRQREVLLAVKDKVMNIGFLPKIIPFIGSLGKNIDTDLTGSELQLFFTFATDYKSYSIHSLGLSDENVLEQGYTPQGAYVLQPKTGSDGWQEVRRFISASLDATPSSALR